MSAADEAREVEVVRGVLVEHRYLAVNARNQTGCRGCTWEFGGPQNNEAARVSHAQHTAQAILAALAPIRAAERQEAAREAFDEGVDAGRNDCCGIPWDQPKWIDHEQPPNPYRADGVTGRSET